MHLPNRPKGGAQAQPSAWTLSSQGGFFPEEWRTLTWVTFCFNSRFSSCNFSTATWTEASRPGQSGCIRKRQKTVGHHM